MDTKQFLSSVLSDEGYYCVVGIKNNKTIQKFYESLDAVAKTAVSLDTEGYDAYFALGTFVEGTNRKADNVQQLKALFLDLDCGVGKPYDTQHDAIVALRGFYKKYELPKPTSVVNSGRGIHVYWALTRPYSREEWLPVAERLKSACLEYGLEADPVVTADAARILRVPNTRNFKADPALSVQILRMGEQHVDLDSFAKKLPETLIPVTPSRTFTDEDSKDMAAVLGQDKYTKKFLKVAKASLSGGGCKQIRRAFLEPDSLSYPDWLHVLSIAKHCEDGEQAIHVVSKGYSGYDPTETEKIASSIDTPHLCMTFENDNPSGCQGCPHKGKIRTPIKLCMEVKEAATNAVEVIVEPQAVMSEGEEEVTEPPKTRVHQVPDYPSPYFRGVNGGVYKRIQDSDGNQDEVLVYDRDLYLTKRLLDPKDGPCFVFEHHTVREGLNTFVAIGTELTNKEQFKKVMGKNDIFLLNREADELMFYVSKWVKYLKDNVDPIHVRTQFGWTEQHKSFILGDKEIFATHIAENPPGARTAQYFPHFQSKGTLEGWKKVTDFYNRPDFEEHQMMFGLAFGAPLMEFIPNVSGAIYHAMSPETGYGKTTGMWGGASIWGAPKRIILKAKDTGNSVWNRAEIYKNLPLYIDEMSNYEPKAASNFVYSVSDGEQRNRLSNSGENIERYRGEPWSTLAGTAGNTSLLEIMTSYRALPKGESGRVIESMITKRLDATDNPAVAALNDDLAANYGHAGVIYIQYILNNLHQTRSLVIEIRDQLINDAKLTPQDRHWVAELSVTYVGCVLAERLNLINWDLDAFYAWMVTKLKILKAGMKEMDIDVKDLVAQFYNDNPRGILRLRSTGDVPEDMDTIIMPDATPLYKWVGRHEYDIHKLYLLPGPFKAWCIDKGHNYSQVRGHIIAQLNGRTTKMRLGRGTKLDLPPQHVLELSWESTDEADTDG